MNAKPFKSRRSAPEMEITVLGSGGTAPTRSRACSSFLVDGKIMIDAGPGSFYNLRKFQMDPLQIQAVLLTHLHGDHLFDLPTLIWGMAADGRRETLLVYGPSGTRDAVKALLEAGRTPKTFVAYDVEVHDIFPGESLKVGAFNVNTAAGMHTIQDVAYRLELGSPSVTFSGDTQPSDGVVRLASKTDVLFHEASFLGQEEEQARTTGHTTATQAGEVARRAEARALVLTHVTPRLGKNQEELVSEARAKFRNVAVSFDGLMVVI